MSRLPADPVGSLAALEAARAGIRKKTILNLGEMAKVAGFTPRGFKLKLDRDPKLPVLQRGDMGVEWRFDAAKVLNHLIAEAKAARAAREKHSAEVSRLAGLGAAAGQSEASAGGPGIGSASDMMLQARAINALIDAQAKMRLERQKQGELVSRPRVAALLTEMMTLMQAETLAIAARMDPAGRWEPGFRAGIEEELRNVLTTVRDRLDREIEALGGPQH